MDISKAWGHLVEAGAMEEMRILLNQRGRNTLIFSFSLSPVPISNSNVLNLTNNQ